MRTPASTRPAPLLAILLPTAWTARASYPGGRCRSAAWESALMERGAHGLGYLDLDVKKGTVTLKLALKETSGDERTIDERTIRAVAKKAVGRF